LETLSSIRIPGSVSEIGDGAFSSLYSLSDLSFEEGTIRIGVSAFAECLNLQNAAFPVSLIEIEANAFQYCDCLHVITFPEESQLKYIRSKAFSHSPLNEVVMPASIVEIDPSAFMRSGEIV
jgi:hypothetical protein